MPVGLSDGTSYNDSADWFAASVDNRTDKQRSNQAEINTNSTAGDFQSRFYATDASTMPFQASTELAGALKQVGSTKVPDNGQKVESERYQLWPERMARSLFDAVKAPGEAVQGKLPMWAQDENGDYHTSPQVIEKMNDLAGLAVMGPAPLAKKMVDGTLGSFAGVTSKTLDKGALEVAQAAEKQGLNSNEIWQKTGFFRGADKRWRYEIDDSGATLKTPEFKKSDFGNYQSKLGDVLDHPELYQAYPGIENVPVNILPWYPSKGAFWNGSSIGGGKEAMKDKSTLMHEVQHAIQDREAFAQGGTPGRVGKDYKLMYEDSVDALRKEYLDLQKEADKGPLSSGKLERLDYFREVFYKYSKYARAGDQKARENYMALAGETEARNVETRLLLEPKDRLKISPMSTEDTPRSEQMVRDKPTLTTPYKGNDGFLSY